MNILDKIVIKYLLSTESGEKVFFASLLTLMKKEESVLTPTMGVTIADGQLYLLYNKDFIESILSKYGTEKLKGILEHELLHIVYDHLSKCRKFNRIPIVYNIASDMAINQMINESLLPKTLPVKTDKGVKWIGELVTPEAYKLPRDKDAEFYYNELAKQMKKKGNGKCSKCGGSGKTKDSKGKEQQCPKCNGSGQSQGQTLDDHSMWEKIQENEQMTKEVIKRAVKEAYQNAKKLRGYLPSHLEEAINELLKPPTVNWRQLLKQYIGASIKTGTKSSWKRPNRRFPFKEEYKGKTAKRTIKILLAIDTSGSISNEDFVDFMSEMRGILNAYKCRIDVVQCDADIQEKAQLHPYSKLNIKFKGRGGTSFTPVFKLFNDMMDYDMLIYFSDMYGDEEECHSQKNVIWVTTRNYNKDTKPGCGRIVNIND